MRRLAGTHTTGEKTPVVKNETDDNLGPNAKVWRSYVDEATARDDEMILLWTQSMDTLLVFSGLFSAVLTAFIVEFYKLLQPDPQQVSIDLLTNILRALPNGTDLPVNNPQTTSAQGFQAPSIALWINCMWFASLAFTLADSLVILLLKQLLEGYRLNRREGSLRDEAHRRQLRFNVIQKWRIHHLINALPTALHLALALFSLGLVALLWTINAVVAEVVLAIVVATLILYLVTTLWPLVDAVSCPFNSPLIFELKVSVCRFISYLIRLLFNEGPLSSSRKFFPRPLDIERQFIEADVPDELTRTCLYWLGSSTRDPEVFGSVTKEFSSVPRILDESSSIPTTTLDDWMLKALLPAVTTEVTGPGNRRVITEHLLSQLYAALPHLKTLLLVVRREALNSFDRRTKRSSIDLTNSDNVLHGWVLWLKTLEMPSTSEREGSYSNSAEAVYGLVANTSLRAYYNIIAGDPHTYNQFEDLLYSLEAVAKSPSPLAVQTMFDALTLCMVARGDGHLYRSKLLPCLFQLLQQRTLVDSPNTFSVLCLTAGVLDCKDSTSARKYFLDNYTETSFATWGPMIAKWLHQFVLSGTETEDVVEHAVRALESVVMKIGNLQFEGVKLLLQLCRKAETYLILSVVLRNIPKLSVDDRLTATPEIWEVLKIPYYACHPDLLTTSSKFFYDQWSSQPISPNPDISESPFIYLQRNLVSDNPVLANTCAMSLVPRCERDWESLVERQVVSSLVTFFKSGKANQACRAWAECIEQDMWSYALGYEGMEARAELTSTLLEMLQGEAPGTDAADTERWKITLRSLVDGANTLLPGWRIGMGSGTVKFWNNFTGAMKFRHPNPRIAN